MSRYELKGNELHTVSVVGGHKHWGQDMAMVVDTAPQDERLRLFEDAIEKWHRSDSSKSLRDYLGVSFDEYFDYVEHGDVPEGWAP